jgi:hypothetical protein
LLLYFLNIFNARTSLFQNMKEINIKSRNRKFDLLILN